MSDRKYRHRGYQDSDSGGSGPKRPRTPMEYRPERLEGAPRGRTAGGFGPEAFKCARCGELQRGFSTVELEAVCSGCNADLHSCANCKNFDTNARWECREEALAARISPKDVRNICTLFAPRIVRDLSADKARGGSSTPDDARKAFEALFKK